MAVTKIQIMKLQKNWQMEREEFGFSQFRHGKQRIGGLSKPDRVREIVKNSFGKITETETVVKCPDINERERRIP